MQQDNTQTKQTGGARRFAGSVLLSIGALDTVFALRSGNGADWLDYGLIAAGVGLLVSAVMHANKR